MDENKRSLWTSLIADLEEEHKAPVAPGDRQGGCPAAPRPMDVVPSRPFTVQMMNGRMSAPTVSHQSSRDGQNGWGKQNGWGQQNGWGHNSFKLEMRPSFHSQTARSRRQFQYSPPKTLPKIVPPPAPAPPPLPRTMPLREWISHHAKYRQVDVVSSYVCWRGGGRNGKVDKEYLEKTVRVSLSLATKLKRQARPLVHAEKISIENITVLDTQVGESDFVNKSTMDTGAGWLPRDERSEICALGRVFYEMFTLGSPPPPSRPRSNDANESENPAAPSSYRLFGNAMRISTEDGDCNSQEHEEDDDLRPRPQRRRRDDEEREHSISTQLEVKGLPASICRLVADMLENENVINDPGGLFCNDNAISTLSVLVDDLEQMADNPKSFLHDSLLMRWKPVIANKLYCRDSELRLAMDVAGRVSHQGEHELDQFDEFDDNDPKQQVLMVSGHSGSGKSHLVRELSGTLENKGWHYLYCKFDRVNPRPLSFIISAFDRYFAKLLEDSRIDPDTSNREVSEIRENIHESFGSENLSILCHLVPNVGHFISEDDTQEVEAQMYGGNFDSTCDTEASKCRLHYIFGLLVNAILQRPILIFFDDLHWADQASLDLIMALVHQQVNGGSQVLFVGSYRSNEVADSDPLDLCLQQIKLLHSVTLTEILLNGLSCEDVNVMVSEALCYPRRLTHSLSILIHHKSTGNPLFVKEFLNDLAVENMLNYSLSARKWEWDEDLIQARTVSDGVAELLTRRLLRLPESVLTALRVISIFGSEVSMQVLAHVRDVCGVSDIIAELDCPVRECLIERSTERCSFVHDMIQHSVHMSIDPEERSRMLKEISETLLVRTTEDRADAILYILVDLINRVGPEGASEMDSMRYASLNLLAGEKAIQTPDYGSACTYLESGISFLNEDHWEDSYNLSLHLFKNAAYVHHAQGESELMMKRLNEVLHNARSFDDKLDSLNVLINSLSLDAKSVSKAFDQSFLVLEELGEQFPAAPDNKVIAQELLEVKNMLEQYVPSSLSSIQPMSDPQKIKAMNFLPMLLISCYQQKSRHFPPIACRMVKITLQHGMHEKSAFGFGSFALAYATVFKDMSQGYTLGKYALALTISNKNIPEVYCMLYGAVNVWKEPIQAILPELLNANKVGMESGNISYALINSMLYVYRAFLSGSKLDSLGKEAASFLRLYSLYRRHTLNMSVSPFANAISLLSGTNRQNKQDCFDDDITLAKSLEVKELNVSETVVVCKMLCSFIIRDLEEAEKVALQYLDFYEEQGSGSLQFINIYRYFYGGLIAFDCFRKSQSEPSAGGRSSDYWMDVGMRSIAKFEAWSTECEWNFKNKLLLLQAEHQFSCGQMKDAGNTYSLAIASAGEHRFVNEEALSCELAGIFHRATGRKDQSLSLIRQAVDCYKSWGAHEKANALLQSLK